MICPTHQKKCFATILGNFWKIEFLTEIQQAQTLKYDENFVLSQNGLRKYFWANFFVPLIKRSVALPFNGNFREIELLTDIRQAQTLQK